MRNGRMLLEGSIAFCNGKGNPIHIFSAEELQRTSHYDQHQRFQLANDFDLYKGSLKDRLVSVKKYRHEIWGLEEIIKDIVFLDHINECPPKCSETLRMLLRD